MYFQDGSRGQDTKRRRWSENGSNSASGLIDVSFLLTYQVPPNGDGCLRCMFDGSDFQDHPITTLSPGPCSPGHIQPAGKAWQEPDAPLEFSLSIVTLIHAIRRWWESCYHEFISRNVSSLAKNFPIPKKEVSSQTVYSIVPSDQVLFYLVSKVGGLSF